jgi:drug/metabolite transporter superfamily protein YnfA
MISTVIIVLLVVALILAAIDEFEARGRAFTSWAAIIIAAVLLYERLA